MGRVNEGKVLDVGLCLCSMWPEGDEIMDKKQETDQRSGRILKAMARILAFTLDKSGNPSEGTMSSINKTLEKIALPHIPATGKIIGYNLPENNW